MRQRGNVRAGIFCVVSATGCRSQGERSIALAPGLPPRAASGEKSKGEAMAIARTKKASESNGDR